MVQEPDLGDNPQGTYTGLNRLPERSRAYWSDNEISSVVHESSPSPSTLTLETQNGGRWKLGGDTAWTENRNTLTIQNPITNEEELLKKIHWEDSKWQSDSGGKQLYLSESGYLVVTARFVTGAGYTKKEGLCYAGPYRTARSKANWKNVYSVVSTE